MKLYKTKQEKDIERKIKARQGKKTVERHNQRQKANIEKYWALAKRAYRMRDPKRFEQIATYILSTQRDVMQWERRLLDFDMIEAQRDQVLAAADFAMAYEQMAKSMMANSDPASMARIQKDIQTAMLRAEMMEGVLENLSDISQELIDDVKLSDRGGEINQIMAALRAEADEESKAPDDKELEASLRAIEEQMKRS